MLNCESTCSKFEYIIRGQLEGKEFEGPKARTLLCGKTRFSETWSGRTWRKDAQQNLGRREEICHAMNKVPTTWGNNTMNGKVKHPERDGMP